MSTWSRCGFTMAVLVGACQTACFPHVDLTAPPATAPSAERLQAYEELHPVKYRHTEVISKYGNYSRTEFLELASGKRVYFPTDLLPVVDARSPAAAAIEDSERHRKTGNWTLLGAVGAILTGSVLIVSDLAANGSRGRNWPFYTGIGLGVAGVIAIPIGNGLTQKASDEAETAYKRYDAGLLRRLDLCEDQGRVTPCQ